MSDADLPTARRWRRLVAALLPYVLFLGFGLTFFPSTGRDDSHITYWAAYALSHFGEIVNYSGLRVEQSTSLLQTLILAGLHVVSGVGIVDLGTPSSVLFGLLSIYLTGRLAARLDPALADESRILTATFLSLVYWSFGGMETTLVCAVALAVCAFTIDVATRPGAGAVTSLLLALGAYLLVRPDTYFIAALFFVLLAFGHRGVGLSYRVLTGLFGFITVAYGLIVTWRWHYFGALFPQPVTAKIGTAWLDKVIDGFAYLAHSSADYLALPAFALALIAALVMLARGRAPQPAFAVVALFLLAQLSAVVAEGGDWMEGGRFIAPLAPFAVIVLLYVLKAKPTLYKLGVPAILVLNIVSLFIFALRASPSMPIFYYERYASRVDNRADYSFFELANRLHIRDTEFVRELDGVVSQLLAKRGHVTVMSVQAGMVFYRLARRHFGEITFVDLPSLVSRDFAECRTTRRLVRGRSGLEFDYYDMREYRGSLLTECLGSPPEVIFDLDYESFSRAAIVGDLGYAPVLFQTGKVQLHDVFPGEFVGAEAFIMVRRDLAEEAGFRFRSVPF